MRFFSSEIPTDALTALIRKKMHLKIARGMKIRPISDHSVLLEDLEEWVWSDMCMLQSAAKYELSFDVYASSGDTLPGVSALITAHPRAVVPYLLALALNVALGVCSIFWVATVWSLQVPGFDKLRN